MTETKPASVPDSIVSFEHKLFESGADSHFRISEHTDEPVLVMSIADNEAVLPFNGIRRELNIEEESPDGQMLDAVAEGLKFVKVLRQGDPLPKEALTGEPSWEAEAVHKQIAYQRLAMQLVSWMTGEEMSMSSSGEILQIADHPETKTRISAAFDEAAEQMGLGRGNREQVVNMIEGMADKLAHIEALRDRMREIEAMGVKIQKLRRLYGNELAVLEVADSAARLMGVAIKDYRNLFMQIDAQTCEVMSILKNIDAHSKFIQDLRNDLYRRLVAWDDILEQWKSVEIKRSLRSEDLLRESYRFLAPRFMPVDEWVLVTKLNEAEAAGSTEMVW